MSKFATQYNGEGNFGSYLHYKGHNLAAVVQDILDQRAYDTRNQIDKDILDKWEQEDLTFMLEND